MFKYLLLHTLFLLLFSGSYAQRYQKTDRSEAFYNTAYNIVAGQKHNRLSQAAAKDVLFHINQAINLNPFIPKYYHVRGIAFSNLKNIDSAFYNFSVALHLDSNFAPAWIGLGTILEDKNEFSGAEYCYLKTLELDNTFWTAYYNLGGLYHKVNQDSAALVAYNVYIQLVPDALDAYSNRGTLLMTMGDYSNSIKDFDHVLLSDSTDKMALNNRGLCRYYTGNYMGAIADLQHSIQIKGGEYYNENYETDTYALNNIANCYFSLGNTAEACRYWKKALEMGYKYKPEWKKEFRIDDPAELVKKYCN